jgi:hypothetical protein
MPNYFVLCGIHILTESFLDKNITTDFPELIEKLPMKVSKIVVDMMDLDQSNNWTSLVTEVWPLCTARDIKIKFKGGMEKVLETWGSEGGKVEDLLHILMKLKRKDVLHELQTVYPSIRHIINLFLTYTQQFHCKRIASSITTIIVHI